MKIGVNNHHAVFAGNLNVLRGNNLKSSKERTERQQETDRQVEYWEQKKSQLKKRSADTVEAIARKLEDFHTYEDQIQSVKKAAVLEEFSHVIEEAEEFGEKVAKAADKLAPKTPEEKIQDLIEEAEEEDSNNDMLSEVTEEISNASKLLLEQMKQQIEEEPEDIEEQLEKMTEETLETNIVEEQALKKKFTK